MIFDDRFWRVLANDYWNAPGRPISYGVLRRASQGRFDFKTDGFAFFVSNENRAPRVILFRASVFERQNVWRSSSTTFIRSELKTIRMCWPIFESFSISRARRSRQHNAQQQCLPNCDAKIQ